MTLFESLLGDGFQALHPHVRRAHVPPLAAMGAIDVQHGAHWLAPLIVALMGLPPAGRRLPARLTVAADGEQLEWTRQIGPTVLRTRQRAAGARLVEQRGIGRLAFDLEVDDGALVYGQAWMGLGPIGIPRILAPRVAARVSPAAAGWHVDVSVMWRARLVCHYSGAMEPA